MTAKTKTLLPGHRVSVRAGSASKWIQDTTITLATGDSLTINGQVVTPPVEPPPVTPPPSGQVIRQFSGTPAAFLALAADQTVDVIEWAAGTYPWVCFLNVARTRPLLVRPKGNVIWDGGGGADPAWRIGWGGFASNITFEGPWRIQNYRIGSAGIVMARYTDHITMNGVTVRDCSGNVAPQSSHALYLETDGAHRGKAFTANGWDVLGPANRWLNGLHIYHDLNYDGVEAKGWVVDSLHRAAYLWADPTGVVVDGWTIRNCDATMDSSGGSAKGVVSNCNATNSGPLKRGMGYWPSTSGIVDGGGNVAS